MESGFFLLLGLGLFLFGLIIGSFLNVLVLRYNTGRSLSGRSGCLSCNATLSAIELIPVLSYLFLRGKCLTCQSPISLQYPLVEVATGLLFLGSFWLFNFSVFSWFLLGGLLSYFVLVSSLVALVTYDLKHQIIPDSFVVVFGVSALLFRVLGGESISTYLLSGLVLSLPFCALWYFSRGKYMGLGDGKLVFGLGVLLGLSQGLSAIIIGFWSGALFGLALLLTQHVHTRLSLGGVPLTMKSEIPFAPFLAFGAVLVLFTQISLVDVSVLVSLF